jgi:hypothetical protein
MHKIITPLVLMLGVSFLTACTNPIAKNEDFATVTAAHRNALVTKMVPESFTSPNGEAKFSGDIKAQMNTGSFQGVFSIDSQVMGLDSDTAMTLSGSANTPDLGGAMSMNLNMNMISKSGSGYLRINALDLITADPAISGMLGGFVGSLKGKWLLLDGETATLDQSRNQELIRELRKSFAERNLLVMTRDLGLENGMYRYEISIDKKELFELAKTITKASTGTGMTTAELERAQKSIDASSFSGTLTVNQSNKEYGAMTLNYSLVEAGRALVTDAGGAEKLGGNIEQVMPPEVGSVSYDFNADGMKLGFKNVEQGMTVDLKKNLTKYTGNITVTDQSRTRILPIEISKNGDTFVMNIKYAAIDKTEQIQSLEATMQMGVVAKSDIVVTAPTGATPISEMLGGLLGGGGRAANDEGMLREGNE